jgi:CRISPR-associated protein Cas8a1/Csx13
MHLFAPGMSALHRAGLGGLACTLKALERESAADRLGNDKLPGPVVGGAYPWEVTDDTVTLRFGKPELAGEYLQKLFAFAFQITDSGLIYLPGQHDTKPADAILADLQAGFTLTFLQHGRVRGLAKEPTVANYDLGTDAPLTVEYKKCSYYKHQCGWEELTDKHGCLVAGVVKVDGPISPGTVIRHVQYTSDTGAEDPIERMLPLYFALVGCLSLSVNRGVAALIVPGVEDLNEFSRDRPAMTPTTATDCQIANAADAAFRAQVRARRNPRRDAEVKARARGTVAANAVPACFAMTFTPTPWASQQKSRVATVQVPEGTDERLDRYERAALHLPARIVTRTVRESTGKGKQRRTTERQEAFRSESVVRPLVAENLARGRKWYAGFAALMTKINPATDKPFRDRLPFERGGLHAMIADKDMWDEAGERIVVQAVHEALRGRYAQIADENKNNRTAMRNRFGGEYDRWRLAFAGAKTPDQFRRALCDLFSRAGRNTVLQAQWATILPMLRQNNWQHARDLALLALCSYQSNRTDKDDDEPTENPSKE